MGQRWVLDYHHTEICRPQCGGGIDSGLWSVHDLGAMKLQLPDAHPCDRPSGGMHEEWQHDILSIPAEPMPSAGNRLICKQTVLTEPTSPEKYGGWVRHM